jgi:hypothetical protein
MAAERYSPKWSECLAGTGLWRKSSYTDLSVVLLYDRFTDCREVVNQALWTVEPSVEVFDEIDNAEALRKQRDVQS